MNTRLFCFYSRNQSLQQYANSALMESFSTTVFEAEISEGGIVFKIAKSGTLLRSIGFVIESGYENICELSDRGVEIICLEEDNTSDFSNYDALKPLIMVSGPIHTHLSGSLFLRIINEAIATYSKIRMKINLDLSLDFISDE